MGNNMCHIQEVGRWRNKKHLIIAQLVHKVSGREVTVSLGQDLRDDLLDSLDILVFFMELEKETGIAVPETETLVEDGWYKVDRLCAEIMKKQKTD